MTNPFVVVQLEVDSGFSRKVFHTCGEKRSYRGYQSGEMRGSLVLSFALVLQFIDKAVLGELAIVHGDVKLTASKNCPDRDVFQLTTADNSVTLARRLGGLWRAAPGGPFIGRVEHHAPSSLILTDLNYKDSGHVVFVCNGDDFNTVELKVLVPHIKNVTEGETAEFSCYSSTDKQVKWFKERGKIRVRDAFSKKDQASPGRFLLTLREVRLEDQGVYFCNAPMAFKLIVNPRPDQTTSPPPHHPSTTQSHNEGNEMRPREIFSWVLVALFGAAAIVLAIFLHLEKKKGRKPKGPPERSVNGGQREIDDLLDQTKRNGSHVNNRNSH